jgi:hypothetical protein
MQGDESEADVKTTNTFIWGADPAYTPPRYAWRMIQHHAEEVAPAEVQRPMVSHIDSS